MEGASLTQGSGWHNNSQGHKLASMGIKTRTMRDMRLKKPVKVLWEQENKMGKMIRLEKDFKDHKEASEHIIRLEKSADSINKPLNILEIKQITRRD